MVFIKNKVNNMEPKMHKNTNYKDLFININFLPVCMYVHFALVMCTSETLSGQKRAADNLELKLQL